MSNLKEYFRTDWSAMTGADWLGLLITVGAFVLLAWVYFYVFRPKNRERLESHRDIPFQDDDGIDNGESR